MRKRDIVKSLKRQREKIDQIITAFDGIDSDDERLSRHSYLTIVMEFFQLMDEIGKVEIDTYNYCKKRGWKSYGVQSKKENTK